MQTFQYSFLQFAVKIVHTSKMLKPHSSTPLQHLNPRTNNLLRIFFKVNIKHLRLMKMQKKDIEKHEINILKYKKKLVGNN